MSEKSQLRRKKRKMGLQDCLFVYFLAYDLYFITIIVSL